MPASSSPWRTTPSLPALEVKALLDVGTDMVVLDARRFDEYQTMSIPTGISVPGAGLALRVRELAPDPATLVVVNCAGRTRSIIGTQSLVNAGIPNRVAALRNGTIGWTLEGLALEHGQQRRFGPASAPTKAPTPRARPCRPTWIGSTGWSTSWPATARTGSGCCRRAEHAKALAMAPIRHAALSQP